MSVDTHVLEIESKFEVPVDATLPDLTGLPRAGAVGAPREVDLEASYYDTAALDLMSLGITLRRRRGGEDAGWHLKLPSDKGRHEVRVPLGDDERVPQRLEELLRGTTRGARLRKVGTVSTRRTVLPVVDAAGNLVAEVCDDRVVGERRRGEREARLVWREWEVELTEDDAELARATTARLREAGASPSRYASKLAHVLDVVPPQDVTGASPGAASARDVLAPYLDAQVRRLRQLDPQVRADLPDAVHQMRVACRRIRAVLACYRRDFDRRAASHLRAELGWLVDVLGRERDLEVLRDHLGALVAQHESTDAAQEAWIDEALARDLAAARETARRALDGGRYDALVLALTDPAAWPPWSPNARRPARRELRRGLRAEWTRLEAAAKAAEHAPSARRDESLHEVRKVAKRLRYAAEAAQPRFGERASALAHAMSALQDTLGQHHDETVARTTVAGLGQQRSRADGGGDVRRVLDDLRAEQSDDLTAYRDQWAQAPLAAGRRWLG
ncbi:CYTH and CHAD domain-containing protein [Nocardioides sp. QY071]|uniref:CYTH and CHAD domain-containing protein n=1 Tax=Nocardioides sp. QY071 TaxID=3044187 RepID=UPI00249B7C60|nr:CYTH and CHAD domain-containing protein [Nocardioides sp. QY071]WGY04524.1 CYTH and CHAD domain-containing protein [Nocardioides sp. QY071]